MYATSIKLLLKLLYFTAVMEPACILSVSFRHVNTTRAKKRPRLLFGSSFQVGVFSSLDPGDQ